MFKIFIFFAENLNQNLIFKFVIKLLNKYNYANFGIIVCNYLTQVLLKLEISENYLLFIYINIFIKRFSFYISRYIIKTSS